MSEREFTIERLQPEQIGDVEPLWNALREHHAALAPQWGPPRTREASWAIRSAQYAGWLADPEHRCFVARSPSGEAVGYALVRLHGVEALWPTDRSAELETLSVLPGWRSAGVGAALLTAAREDLAARGIDAMSIFVLHSNTEGLKFYARHGFEPGAINVWGTTDSRTLQPGARRGGPDA